MEESIDKCWPLLPSDHPFSSFPNLKSRLKLRNRFWLGILIYSIAVIIVLVISMFYGYEYDRTFTIWVIFPLGIVAFVAPCAFGFLVCMRLDEVYKPRVGDLREALCTKFDKMLTSNRTELAALAERRLQELVDDVRWYEQHGDSMHLCCEYQRRQFRWCYKVFIYDNALLKDVGYTAYFKTS